MSFSFPNIPGSLMGSHGLLSSLPAVRRRQLSRISAYAQGKRRDPKKNRLLRKALYKQKMKLAKLPQDVRDDVAANPLQHGTPRLFKVLLAGNDVVSDAKLHDISRFTDEGHHVYFASFGVPGKPVRFNDTWIEAENIKLSPDRRTYTLKTDNGNNKPVNMHFDFTQISSPVGHIETSDGFLAMSLQPWAVSYNVKLSNNAGAYLSTGSNTLVWDKTSMQWQNATWEENSLVFSYDTVRDNSDPFGNHPLVNEASFKDAHSNPDPFGNLPEFDLTVEIDKKYTVLFKDDFCLVNVLNVDDVPAPPPARSTDVIKSVFPQKAYFIFDSDDKSSFTGALEIPQKDSPSLIYAVVGVGVMPGISTLASGLLQSDSRIPSSSQANVQPDPQDKKKPLLHTRVQPVPRVFSLSANDTPTILPITGLINNDPMVPNSTDPTQYVDSIAETANNDFHDIICYFMDSDIHTTFISSTPTTLADSTVLSIATDSSDNATFYKTLQTPYVTASLGRSKLEEGKECNVIRADAQLKTLPADSPTYARHSDALYRHRYMQSFPGVQSYLDDQANTDYGQNIDNGAAAMKTDITNMSNSVNGPDSSLLDAALSDIDSLAQWAKAQKLYYAFDLYWWCQHFFLPSMISMSADGNLSASVSRSLKKYTLIFGILENGQQNLNGKSFAEAFNDLVRLFQMSVNIPQFVDADANSEDLDSLEKEMLLEFYNENKGSPDPIIVDEANRALELSTNDWLRRNFFDALALSMRLSGTLGSWTAIVQMNLKILNMATWFKTLSNGTDLFGTFMRSANVAVIMLPMIYGMQKSWSIMSPTQRATWIISAAALCLTFFIKGLQSVVRLYTFWDDLAGVLPAIKAFMGFKSVLEVLPAAAQRTESALAQWLLRGNEASMNITGDAVTVGMKLFGRSAGEFLTNCVGAVLAGVNIVMSAIDLAKTTNPLQKDIDTMLIISSGLQLLAIGASWLVTAAFVTDALAVSVLSTAAAIAGPLAIVFAIAGICIMIALAKMQPSPPNPVQDFVNTHAANANLKMDFGTAIDYFNVVPSDATAPSLNGISFQDANAMDVTSSPVVLQLSSGGDGHGISFPVLPGTSITYLPDTCWNVSTDSTGITTIWTYSMYSVLDQIPLCLTRTSDGTVHALPPPLKSTKDANGNDVPVDPAVYAQQLSLQQWSFQTMSAATTATRSDGTSTNTFVTSAQFVIGQGNNVYLDTNTASDGTATITSAPVYWHNDPSVAPKWTLTLQSMSPSDFSYIQPAWELNTNERDEQNEVVFSGSTSSPLSWAITPALPSFLTLASDGTIKQVAGVAPTPIPATVYSVTATVVILLKSYSKQADVTISVIDSTAVVPPTAVTTISHAEDATLVSSVVPTSGKKPNPDFASSGMDSFTPGQQGTPGEATTRVASESSLQDGPEPQLQKEFDTFMQTTPALFSWQQAGPVPLNQHYTAIQAITRMQNSLTGTWDKAESWFRFDNVAFESIYFPNPAGWLLAADPNDTLDYHGAAQAFVAQCIYNGDGYAQQYCNVNDTYNATAAFNQGLWTANTQRFIGWLQGSFIFGAPASCSLAEYQACLEHPTWIAFKRALQASGTWANQSLEMYFHLLKLSAIGGTSDQITAIYNAITGDNGLDPSGFTDITPATWTLYRGYLFSGPISYAQLGVQNLNTVNYYSSDGGAFGSQSTQHADTSFIRQAGYYKSPPPSGCCFAAGTRIQHADGVQSVPIERIVPGMSVASPSRNNTRATRVVKSISKPRREGRPMYSFHAGLEDVRFTATHPILLRYDEETGLPVLGFVDVGEALRGNPLWAAFQLETLPAKELLQSAAASGLTNGAGQEDDEEDEEEEVLYDLIFELTDTQTDTSDVAVFVVCQPTSEKTLLVCSEAPDISALPGMTRFVLAFLEAIGSRADTARFFPDGLRSGTLDYLQRIKRHRNAAAADVSTTTPPHQSTSRFGKAIHLDTVLSVIRSSAQPAQVLMDASEAVASALGLGLQCHLDNGWQFSPSSPHTANEPLPIFCISTHHLSLAQTPLLRVPADLERVASQVIHVLTKTLLNASTITLSMSTFPHAHDNATIKEDKPITTVACKSIGSHLHRLPATLKLPIASPPLPTTTSPYSTHYTLTLTLPQPSTTTSTTTLNASGTVTPDIPALWPLHITTLTGISVDDVRQLGNWHVGWIAVTGAMVAAETLDRAGEWWDSNEGEGGHGVGVPRGEAYAEGLGKRVGRDVLETVYGREEKEEEGEGGKRGGG